MEPTGKDPMLWKTAMKRASFKRHLYTYLVINGFFWILWAWTTSDHTEGIPWPLWPMLGWGLGIAFSYYEAFKDNSNIQAEREYEKLKKEQDERR